MKELPSLRINGQMLDGSIIDPQLHGHEAAEKRMREIMLEYEGLYFQDMTFSSGSITGDIFCLYEDLGRKKKNFLDVPFNLSIEQVDIKFKNLHNVKGVFLSKDMAIHFHYSLFDWRTVMHEMIHAYSYILLKINKSYPLRDFLILKLYEKLRSKVQDIKFLVTAWAHFEHMETFRAKEWDGHGILFYLKSLDLELELNQPFGIIRSYPFDKVPKMKREK